MWKQHDNYMKQLQQLYNKTSKQTQNRLQGIFDTFNFITDNIYNISDSKTKKRINTYIEQWKEQGLVLIHFHTVCPAFSYAFFYFSTCQHPFFYVNIWIGMFLFTRI